MFKYSILNQIVGFSHFRSFASHCRCFAISSFHSLVRCLHRPFLLHIVFGCFAFSLFITFTILKLRPLFRTVCCSYCKTIRMKEKQWHCEITFFLYFIVLTTLLHQIVFGFVVNPVSSSDGNYEWGEKMQYWSKRRKNKTEKCNNRITFRNN